MTTFIIATIIATIIGTVIGFIAAAIATRHYLNRIVGTPAEIAALGRVVGGADR